MSTLNTSDINALYSKLSKNYVRGNAQLAQAMALNISSGHTPGQTGSTNLLDSMSGKNGVTTSFGKQASVPTPEWDQYLTKRSAEMSDEKYVEAIKEQARKDREAGVYQKSDGFNSLKMSYVSVASPDRKGIVAKAQQAGTSQGLMSQYGQYKDDKGQTVAIYGQKFGWMMLNTDAENKRSTEFLEIYNSEYFANGEKGEEEVASGEGGGLDVEA